MSWPDWKVEILKTMWKNGASASEIGSEIDVTRNAVIGKAHRIGLAQHVRSPRKSGASGVKKRAARVSRPKGKNVFKLPFLPPKDSGLETAPPEMPPVPIGPRGIVPAIESLRRGACRAPVCDPASDDFAFCGAPSDGSYCGFHRPLYHGATARRVRAA